MKSKNDPGSNPIKIKDIIAQYYDNRILRYTLSGGRGSGKSTLTNYLLLKNQFVLEHPGSSINEESKGAFPLNSDSWASFKRKFIGSLVHNKEGLAHMITNAFEVNLSIIVIDSINGLEEEIAELMNIFSTIRIPRLLVCINKMDVVDYSQGRYDELVMEFKKIMVQLNIYKVQFIPICALTGDNVVVRSKKLSWYSGPTLFEFMECLEIDGDHNQIDGRFPIQCVFTPSANVTCYAGSVASGMFRTGESVIILPGGYEAVITQILCGFKNINEAFAPLNILVSLHPSVKVQRGDLIAKKNNRPQFSTVIEVVVIWLNEISGKVGTRYLINHIFSNLYGYVEDIQLPDRGAYSKVTKKDNISLNEIGLVRIILEKPIYYDSYWRNRTTGYITLMNETSLDIVAVGMMV